MHDSRTMAVTLSGCVSRPTARVPDGTGTCTDSGYGGSDQQTPSAGGPYPRPMRIGVLGTTVATDDTGPVSLGGPKQRALLAALALHRGRAVAVDTLADLVWDGAPPRG